jgi:hypothetical protein
MRVWKDALAVYSWKFVCRDREHSLKPHWGQWVCRLIIQPGSINYKWGKRSLKRGTWIIAVLWNCCSSLRKCVNASRRFAGTRYIQLQGSRLNKDCTDIAREKTHLRARRLRDGKSVNFNQTTLHHILQLTIVISIMLEILAELLFNTVILRWHFQRMFLFLCCWCCFCLHFLSSLIGYVLDKETGNMFWAAYSGTEVSYVRNVGRVWGRDETASRKQFAEVSKFTAISMWQGNTIEVYEAWYYERTFFRLNEYIKGKWSAYRNTNVFRFLPPDSCWVSGHAKKKICPVQTGRHLATHIEPQLGEGAILSQYCVSMGAS